MFSTNASLPSLLAGNMQVQSLLTSLDSSLIGMIDLVECQRRRRVVANLAPELISRECCEFDDIKSSAGRIGRMFDHERANWLGFFTFYGGFLACFLGILVTVNLPAEAASGPANFSLRF